MKYVLGVAAIVIVAVVGFFGFRFLQRSSDVTIMPQQVPTDELATTVWVEVLGGKVFYASAATATEVPVASGDVVQAGGTVRTDGQGKAVIHFPDSSFASLDVNTKLTLSETSYDPTTQSLVAKFFLTSGRVWSKIFDLATPTSAWEVKTANAVATVRGTAFGMEYRDKKSRVLGSQHTVRVVPVSKSVMTKAQVDVKEDEQVEITDAQADAIASGRTAPTSFVSPRRIDPAIDPWAANGKKEEARYEGELKKLKDSGVSSPKELRVKMRTLFEKQFEGLIKERVRAIVPTTQPSTDDSQNPTGPTGTTVQPTPSGQQSGSTGTTSTATTTPTGTAAKVVLTTKADLSSVTAGSVVNFSAVLVRPDGSRQDVTAASKWNVVGDIGSFPTPGKFQPSLTGSATELEKAPGAVVVSFDDQKTGSVLSAKSDIFYVQNSPSDPNAVPIGGQ